jgi:hypothetical protein
VSAENGDRRHRSSHGSAWTASRNLHGGSDMHASGAAMIRLSVSVSPGPVANAAANRACTVVRARVHPWVCEGERYPNLIDPALHAVSSSWGVLACLVGSPLRERVMVTSREVIAL